MLNGAATTAYVAATLITLVSAEELVIHARPGHHDQAQRR